VFHLDSSRLLHLFHFVLCTELLFFFFFREFGPKVINIKLVLKQVPVLLEDRDKNVREEGKKLVVELYRWIGQALKPQLSALKPIQVIFFCYIHLRKLIKYNFFTGY
jgi:hypothetical protein